MFDLFGLFRRKQQPAPTGRQQRIIVWQRGHTTHTIDLDSAEAVREAEAIFNRARRQGMTAFRTSPAPATLIHEYDPEAEIIEFVQPIMGG